MKYSWVIFDADGTLFDFTAAEADALLQTLEQFSIDSPPDTLERYREITVALFKRMEAGDITFEHIKENRFSQLFRDLDISMDLAAFSDQYLKNLSANSRLLPHAHDTVSKAAGMADLLLLTNGNSYVQRSRLKRSSISTFFKDVVISDELGCAKPSAEIFDIAFQKMGQPDRKDVLMVGDSLSSDIKGGMAYGIDTCWYCPNGGTLTHAAPTYRISRLPQLLEILDNVN